MNSPRSILVLVRPDDPLQRTLQAAGMTVEPVRASHALAVRADEHAMIVADLALPGVTIAALQEKTARAPLPVLVIADDVPAADALPAGFRALRRPFADATLVAAVTSLIGGPGRSPLQQLLDDTGRVSLVDPDDATREALAAALDLEGVQCDAFATLPDACRVLLQRRPDLLLLTRDAHTAPALAFVQQFGQDVPMIWLPPATAPAGHPPFAALGADDNPAAIARALARLLDEAAP
ncbi:MAG: hypothetical protein AB7K09_11145 [Planctomycetota bacterium]